MVFLMNQLLMHIGEITVHGCLFLDTFRRFFVSLGYLSSSGVTETYPKACKYKKMPFGGKIGPCGRYPLRD